MNRTDAVLQAADALIDAFRRNDRAAYFAAFAPEASFVFHTYPRRLDTRGDYESVWDGWVADDAFEVRACESTERAVALFERMAIFTHTVATALSIQGQVQHVHERETIVFREDAEHGWLAVHEHLSAHPREAA
jgi:ketosteroid isomerase-like protein